MLSGTPGRRKALLEELVVEVRVESRDSIVPIGTGSPSNTPGGFALWELRSTTASTWPIPESRSLSRLFGGSSLSTARSRPPRAGRSVEELGAATKADRSPLHRLLRMLTGPGVFREEADGRFAITPLGATLPSDGSDSVRTPSGGTYHLENSDQYQLRVRRD
jgi:hypothetical protein